jgi:DNA polymerase-3 subunit delta
VPSFKPAYLIAGDDHGRISERRARLRALAEAESGTAGVEVLEGDRCTAENVQGALTAMTFALGRRFVIADGVERWKDADVELVASAMKSMDGETLTLAMFGREEGRAKVADGLRKAVEAAGGVISEESGVKPWELPGWVQARARELGLELDKAAA